MSSCIDEWNYYNMVIRIMIRVDWFIYDLTH